MTPVERSKIEAFMLASIAFYSDPVNFEHANEELRLQLLKTSEDNLAKFRGLE